MEDPEDNPEDRSSILEDGFPTPLFSVVQGNMDLSWGQALSEACIFTLVTKSISLTLRFQACVSSGM